MINLTGIRHISFDLWLTLVRSHSDFKQQRSSLLKKHFNVRQEEGVVFDTVRRYDRLFNTVNEVAGGNIETFEIILVILDQLSVDIQQITTEQLEDFYTAMEEKFFAFPPALLHERIPAYLQHLRQSGYTISILSNTAFIKGATLRKFLDNTGLSACFEFQLYSDEIGYSKPHARVFEELVQQAKGIRSISRDEILHVGDNKIADFDGAIKAGMQAQVVKSDGSWLSFFN